jgi:hypothetical protein
VEKCLSKNLGKSPNYLKCHQDIKSKMSFRTEVMVPLGNDANLPEGLNSSMAWKKQLFNVMEHSSLHNVLNTVTIIWLC